MALRVAATLRVADHIAAGTATAPELAKACGADADALDRLLRYLAVRGYFSREDDGRYGLTPLGEPLRDDHPDGMRAQLDLETALGRAELAFVQLLHSVRTGEAGYPLQFGRSFWEDLVADPARKSSFDSSMSALVPARSPAVIGGYDWASLGTVVDVGGGDGSLLIALLRAYPELRGTVVDQPMTARAARRALEEAGLADRGDAVPGDFFEPLPAGAGGYVLSWILHNWNDDAACRILRRCAEAAGAHGRVLVIEKTGPDGRSPHTGMDLRMLTFIGGKERGLAELDGLAGEAGLRVVAVHPAGVLSITELAAA
jgi:hypothetical protein